MSTSGEPVPPTSRKTRANQRSLSNEDHASQLLQRHLKSLSEIVSDGDGRTMHQLGRWAPGAPGCGYQKECSCDDEHWVACETVPVEKQCGRASRLAVGEASRRLVL